MVMTYNYRLLLPAITPHFLIAIPYTVSLKNSNKPPRSGACGCIAA
jgi:hypothetical protein